MVPEIEIKVSESGTITEIGNKDFQFRDNGYCYLFIYLFIYNLFNITYYASISLSHYVPNLLLLILQYHCLIFTYLLHINSLFF